MTLEFETVPCLSDNYAYLVHDPDTGATAVVDVPEAQPILNVLERRGWTLTDVLLTHHHWDHVDGLTELLESAPALVTGAAADAHRLPPLDIEVREGDVVKIGNEAGTVIDVSGHTVGHIAFHAADVGKPVETGRFAGGYDDLLGPRIHHGQCQIRPEH
jgi:hydroxyacylglutathione hydrolase